MAQGMTGRLIPSFVIGDACRRFVVVQTQAGIHGNDSSYVLIRGSRLRSPQAEVGFWTTR
jgi:hypothetical protein